MNRKCIAWGCKGWGAALVLLICGVTSAYAQGFPNRPVRFVVPLPPGGAGDIVARTVAAKLSEMWGQQIVIDNRGGANTIIGTDIVAKARPDGYTWLLGVQGSLVLNPVFYPKLQYDAVNDFDPVIQITNYGYVLVVHPLFPVKSVSELVALGKSRPGQLTYGTSGTGGSNHLAGEMFRLLTGVQMTPVPYKGSAPALTALLASEITVMFDTLITSIPQLRAGRLRALGVTLARRSSSLPDVPTIAEAGVPGYRFEAWQSIVLPAGSGKEIVNKIYADAVRVLAMPDVRRKLIDEGANELVGAGPEQLASLIRADIEKYRKLVRDAGISAN